MSMRFERPPLVIEHPWDHLQTFFTLGGSRKYDSWITSGESAPNRIVRGDVYAMNRSMRARCPHKYWQSLYDDNDDIPELAVIDPGWNLFTMSDVQWKKQNVLRLLDALFTTVIRKGINIPRATKILHIKRPALIPVCDAYVLRLLGIPGTSANSGLAAVIQIRTAGRANLKTLEELQQRLKTEPPKLSRTLVRITDALVWGSHPDSWLGRRAAAEAAADDEDKPGE